MPELRGFVFKAWLEVEDKQYPISEFSIQNGTVSPTSFPIAKAKIIVGYLVGKDTQNPSISKADYEIFANYPPAKVTLEIASVEGISESPSVSPGTYTLFLGDIISVVSAKTVTWGQENAIQLEVGIAHILRRLGLGDVSTSPFYDSSFFSPFSVTSEPRNEYDSRTIASKSDPDIFSGLILYFFNKRLSGDFSKGLNDATGGGAASIASSLRSLSRVTNSKTEATTFIQEAIAKITSTLKLDKLTKTHLTLMYQELCKSVSRTTPADTYLSLLWTFISELKAWVVPNAVGAEIRPILAQAVYPIELGVNDYHAIKSMASSIVPSQRFIGGGAIFTLPAGISVHPIYANVDGVMKSYMLPDAAGKGGFIMQVPGPSWIDYGGGSSQAKLSGVVPSRLGTEDLAKDSEPENNTTIPEQYLKHTVISSRLAAVSVELTLPLRLDVGLGSFVKFVGPVGINEEVESIGCVTGLTINLNSETQTVYTVLELSQVETSEIYGILDNDAKHPFTSNTIPAPSWAVQEQ